MEGVASEAASLAGHLALGKLIVLYDDNKVSLAASTVVTFTEDVRERFEAYGWHTSSRSAPNTRTTSTRSTARSQDAKAETLRPSLIAMRTTIGYGSPRAGHVQGARRAARPENMQDEGELGWPLELPPFTSPTSRRSSSKKPAPKAPRCKRTGTRATTPGSAANPELAAQFERARDGKLPANLPWPTFNAENGNVATRDAGGTVMNAIAAALPELVGGSADLDPSTKTYLKDHGDFQPGNYAGRNIHYGVREHAMAAATNGIALHGGLLPFGATFFNFLDYLKPALRLAALNLIREVLRLHARLGVLGRGRPDAPADRAARDAARDAERASTSGRPTRSRRSKRGSTRCSPRPARP